MNRNIMRGLLASLVLAAVAACTDVTTEPKSTVTSANIFNESGSYRAFLAKLYGGLAVTGQSGPAGNGDIGGIDEGFSHYVRLYWQMEELPTDEAVIAWNDAGVQELNTQLWSSSNQFLVAMYNRIFYQSSLANEFLRETTDAKLASRGVTINGLLPGAFDTDRLRATMKGASEKTGKSIDVLAEERKRNIPAQRFGSAEEFGAICAFLCSVPAGYITGQNLLADGGAYPGTF